MKTRTSSAQTHLHAKKSEVKTSSSGKKRLPILFSPIAQVFQPNRGAR